MKTMRQLPGPPCLTCPMLVQDVDDVPVLSSYRCMFKSGGKKTPPVLRYIGRMRDGLADDYYPKWCPDQEPWPRRAAPTKRKIRKTR